MVMAHYALELINFSAWHRSQGLLIRGLNVQVSQGQTVAFISAHQQTRDVLMHSLIGRHQLKQGSVRFLNMESILLNTSNIHDFGVVHCDPEQGIVPHLNCEENLLLPPDNRTLVGGGLPLWEIFHLFPALENTLNSLSSGLSEDLKLQLAWARALRTGARIFIFERLAHTLPAINLEQTRQLFAYLNQRNYTIIMIEGPFSALQQLACQTIDLEQFRHPHMRSATTC